MVAVERRRRHRPPRAPRMYPGAGVVPPHSHSRRCACCATGPMLPSLLLLLPAVLLSALPALMLSEC